MVNTFSQVAPPHDNGTPTPSHTQQHPNLPDGESGITQRTLIILYTYHSFSNISTATQRYHVYDFF